MNQVLEASDLSAGTAPAASVPVRNPAAGMQWENVVRFFLLFALLGAAGHLAWRPSMLRLSVLRTLISPSHGESLAWKPALEITPLTSPVVRTPPPPEWRLASPSGSEASSLRPGTNRVPMWRGAGMGRPHWKRSSANGWNWKHDAPFGTARRLDPEAGPVQKPASQVRAATEAAVLPTLPNALQDPLPAGASSRPTAIAVPSLESPAPVGPGGFVGLPPLAMPSLAERDLPAVPVPAAPAPAPVERDRKVPEQPAAELDEVWGSLRDSMERAAPPGELFRSAGPAATPTAGIATMRFRDQAALSPAAERDAAAALAPLPTLSAHGAGSLPTEGGAREKPPVPSATTSHASTQDAVAGLVEPPVDAGPGGTELPLEAKPVAAGPASGDAESAGAESAPLPIAEGDWLTREISGPIPGAYLTIYPKLNFVGLCVPGHNYIRKYNGVAVPRDLLGEKYHARDGKTPYGKYYIAGHRRDEAGARLVLSWPSPEDARRIGLDPATVDAVDTAWLGQEMPPQTSRAGGGIVLDGLRNRVESTEGGFTLEEPHLEEIFRALADGAWVFIQE